MKKKKIKKKKEENPKPEKKKPKSHLDEFKEWLASKGRL
jgi:hypothetical protein